MRPLPTVLASIGLAALVGATAAAHGDSPAPPPARHVVVAELFTSEGCSSCPPADALLQRIAAQSPVPGVEILGLEEHVDYWDHQGWRDPFSSAAFTRRQNDYDSRVFHLGEIYTPQLVVDGAFASVGSDGGGVRDAIVKAAARPAANVRIRAHAADGRVHVDVSVDVPSSIERRKDAEIVAALVEDGLTTKVERGENSGRTLAHFAVVRSLTPIGTLSAGAAGGATSADLPVAKGWQPSRLRVIAFVQERDSRRILGSRGSAIGVGEPAANAGYQVRVAAFESPRQERSREHLQAKTSVSSQAVAPGVPFELLVDVTPANGIHVYAPGVVGYKPIALRLDAKTGLVSEKPRFPKAEDLYLSELKEHVPVYGKRFRISQPVTIDKSATPAAGHDSLTISGRLEYQACTATVCFPPQSLPLSWTVPLSHR